MSYDDDDRYEPPHRQRESRHRDMRHYREPRESGGGLFSGLVIVALLAGGGYYAWTNVISGPPAQVTSIAPAPTAPVYEPDDNSRFALTTPEVRPEISEAPITQAEPDLTIKAAEPPAPPKPAAAPPSAVAAPPLRAEVAPPRWTAPAAPPPSAFTQAPVALGNARTAAAEIPQATIGVSTAAASATQSDEVVVNARRPIWRSPPRAERLAQYYPASALGRGREGEASLRCIIGKNGALDCERVSEFPERAGFGLAALKVARTLRHVEQRADGSSAIGSPLNLRVVFRMPEGQRGRRG